MHFTYISHPCKIPSHLTISMPVKSAMTKLPKDRAGCICHHAVLPLAMDLLHRVLPGQLHYHSVSKQPEFLKSLINSPCLFWELHFYKHSYMKSNHQLQSKRGEIEIGRSLCCRQWNTSDSKGWVAWFTQLYSAFCATQPLNICIFTLSVKLPCTVAAFFSKSKQGRTFVAYPGDTPVAGWTLVLFPHHRTADFPPPLAIP